MTSKPSATNTKSLSWADAFEDWTLDNVALLLDTLADGKPIPMALLRAAHLDCNMMRRLVQAASAIVAKAERGEIDQAEARRLAAYVEEKGG